MDPNAIQFGIMFFAANEDTLQQAKYRLVTEAAKFADRHGFSSIWVPERHFAKLGGLYPNPSVLHAALSMVTERIHLRAGSVVLPLHHPIRVAEEWSLVDNLSGGRVGISFASGWNPNDFAFFPEKYETRSEEMFRAIPEVRKLWQGRSCNVKNGLGQEVAVQIYPRPVQSDLPTWVTAARSPATFINAGTLGVNVLTHLLDQDVADVAKRIALYRDAREKAGHNPQSGVVTLMLHTFVGRDAEVAREQGRKPYCEFLKSNTELLKALAASRDRQVDWESLSPKAADDFVNFLYDRFAGSRSLIGSPETCLDLVARLRTIGVDEIACLLDFGPSYDLVLENLVYLNCLKELCQSQDFAQPARQPPARSSQNDTKERSPSSDGVLESIKSRCVDVIQGQEFYECLQKSGLDVPNSSRGVLRVWHRKGEALGQLKTTSHNGMQANEMPSALVESCLQVGLAAWVLDPVLDMPKDSLCVPWSFENMDLRGRLDGELFVHAVLTPGAAGSRQSSQGELRILGPSGQPFGVISGLQLREIRSKQAAADPSDEWLYELRWEEKSLVGGEGTDGISTWIILTDKIGIGGALTRLLEERGDRYLLIDQESLLAEAGGRAAGAAAFLNALERVIGKALLEVVDQRCAVAFLWGIDSASPEEITESSLQTDQVVGSSSALTLTQLIAGLAVAELPKLWFVTRGSQRIGKESRPLQIGQSPLWGLGRTCAMEHPELWGGILDLDPEAENSTNAACVAKVVLARSREDQIAFRGGKTFVPRLVRHGRLSPARFTLHKDASYLITGGLKGIGFEVAKWLARKGAKRLVLVGRSPLPPRELWNQQEAGGNALREIEKIRVLESAGAEVVYAAVDISVQAQVTSLINGLASQGPPLRGIIHAASVWRDEQGNTLIRPLANLNVKCLQDVFGPKLVGGWFLHKASEATPLDFFVCFSSAASLTGSAGQGNYAAASVFLDTLAQLRAQAGQRALSINWGPVSGAGFGATAEGLKVHSFWETNGLKRISVEELLDVLEKLIPQPLAQLGVMNMDWEKLSHFFPPLAKAPWAEYLVTSGTDAESSDFLERILEVAPQDRQDLVTYRLRQEVAEVMGLEELPDPRKKLFEMGMDSLMALELRNRLQKALAKEIRVTAVFNYPTIDALSQYLTREIVAVAASDALPKAPQEAVAEDGALSRIKALPEEEVDRLLGLKGKGNPSL